MNANQSGPDILAFLVVAAIVAWVWGKTRRIGIDARSGAIVILIVLVIVNNFIPFLLAPAERGFWMAVHGTFSAAGMEQTELHAGLCHHCYP